jgi:hypothetical protein
MAPKYSASRLRLLVDQRDSARAILDIASLRLKQATADKATASRIVVEFEAAELNIKSDQQAAKADASLARLKAALLAADEALGAAVHARNEAAEIVSTTAAIANAGIQFATSGGWLPSDIRERA